MKLLLRKLLLSPFYLLIVAIDMFGKYFVRPASLPKSGSRFSAGISVVIPERANKPLLRQCLQSLSKACESFEEPVQVIVVVSEAQADMYAELAHNFPADWIFRSEPLWFIDAVALGVGAAKYDWVYLLNSDMVLHPAALHEVAKWRSPSVFAIASQIYFQDSIRRREETGLTEIRNAGGLLELLDVVPEEPHRIRAHAYAGGGSSLFKRALLASFIERTTGYEPFYWEDVEWGVLAWRHGFEVLFCPQSTVWHFHRGTNLKFFSREEIERIFRRNGLLFQLRMALPANASRTVFGTIARLDAKSFREMLNVTRILDTLRARIRSYSEPSVTLQPIPGIDIHYGRPRRPDNPSILIVSPYCVYPPAHGGARRIHELIDRLARAFDIILLSDESENYTKESFKYFTSCHLVCLVSGRRPPDSDDRISRILSHSHSALAAQLEAMLQIHDPDIVQIEYVELAKLIEARDSRPWILTLHDVLLQDTGHPSREDEFELQYINRFDALMVCSPEDAALLKRDNIHLVHNGANPTRHHTPSPCDGPILFPGPFRYPPNLAGIIDFLNKVYPIIRESVSAARLWILGGVDARAIAARYTCFLQPGVTVFDLIEDLEPYLQSCSMTINPDRCVRGSSLKVIESLAAGRICVSTRDGARGLLSANIPSLVIVNENNFASRMVQLLMDLGQRHYLEVPTEALHQYSWQRASDEQARIYRSLSKTGCSSPTYAFTQAETKAQSPGG
jgi:GT2 family glycosyltransferase